MNSKSTFESLDGKTMAGLSQRALVLPQDLLTLITQQGIKPVDIEKISELDVKSSDRGSYRIHCHDGHVMKGRCLASPYLAERVHQVSQQVDSGLLSTIVARHGNAVLEDWIEGHALDSMAADVHLSHAAGKLLGRIHTSPNPGFGCAYGQTLETRKQQLTDSLGSLVSISAITSQEASRASDIALQCAPLTADRGWVHGDLCAENIVLNGENLVAIDNGGLSHDALDFDLARTWYRWPMSRHYSEAFLQGYQQFRDPKQFQQHFLFWSIYVLCRAARFHIRGQTGSQYVPLDRLRTLISSDLSFTR